MAKDYVVIKGQANIIRNETAEGGNTAAEVGGAIYDVADKLEEVDGVLTAALGDKLPISSVVDNLASTSAAAPLSANQGKVLNESKADKTTQVVAGNGLTGGGALSGDVTVNVGNTDDSIVVGADGIKVDTQNSLTSTSTTKPLSAAQGKALQDNKVDTSRAITAGNGLTGGGDLTANRTIDINPADDSLTVTADNVKVNTNNTLTSTSTTQPLSANQGKVLNEKVAQVETDLNNIDVIISGKSPVEGITWGNDINDVLVKNATKYAWLEILDSTFNINQICYFKLVYKNSGILQCFSYNDTFDGHLILTYSAGSALTGEREVVLNGYGAYLNKIKLHLIIDFDQLSGNIIMSNTLINLSLLNTSKHDQIRLDDRVTILERGDLYGKNILCLGDSITEIKLNYKSYPDFISENSGANVINGGIGGTLICARTSTVETPTTSLQAYAALDIISLIQTLIISDKNAPEWKRFYNAVQWAKTHDYDDNTEIYNRLYNVDMNDIDAITIMGGTNDWWYFGQGFTMPNSTNIFRSEGALNQIITLLGSNYPRIKIYWLTPIVRWDPSNSGIRNDATWSDNLSNGSCTLSEFSDRLYAQVKKRHIPICDMYWSLGWNQQNFSSYFYSNDGTHPYKGLKEIGYKVAAFIKSNLTF